MRRILSGTLLALALVAGSIPGARAAKRAQDAIWTRPDYARLHVDRVAFLPVASYDNNTQNETLVEAVFGPALRGTQYRWISGTTTREILRARTGGDSLLKAVKRGVLANGRIDSLQATPLAGLLACSAVLSVRIDQWEQHAPEWNQAGKPYTTVRLRAALVDSLGRLLWTASGTEVGEGPYFDPGTNPIAVNDAGLERKPVTGQGGAPSFREVLTTLLNRWGSLLPPKPAPAPAAGAAVSTGSGGGTSPAAPSDSGGAPPDSVSRSK